MKTIAIEDLVVDIILSFCENTNELGCPHRAHVDAWFRKMSAEKRRDIAGKLLDIMEKDV